MSIPEKPQNSFTKSRHWYVECRMFQTRNISMTSELIQYKLRIQKSVDKSRYENRSTSNHMII